MKCAFMKVLKPLLRISAVVMMPIIAISISPFESIVKNTVVPTAYCSRKIKYPQVNRASGMYATNVEGTVRIDDH